MKIENKDTFVILKDEKDDLADFASFLKKQISVKYKGQNVVINLLENTAFTLTKLLLFLEVSNNHRKTKQSFVLVNDTIHVDDVPFEMIVVPTILEAGDIIEMEEIERDLGF